MKYRNLMGAILMSGALSFGSNQNALSQQSRPELESPLEQALNGENQKTTKLGKATPFLNDEIDQTIASLLLDIESGEFELNQVDWEMRDQVYWTEAREEKYGTLDNPKLKISENFQFKPFSYTSGKFKKVKKDADYHHLLESLYEKSNLLFQEIKQYLVYRPLEEKDLPDLDQLLDVLQLRCKSLPMSTTGEDFTFHTARDLASFIKLVSGEDIKERKNNRYNAFSQIIYFQNIASLKEINPLLFQETDNFEDVKKYLDPLLTRILVGYPKNIPRIIIHPTRELYEKSYTGFLDSLAFHDHSRDVIETYKSRVGRLMLSLSHEIGHAISWNGELEMINYTDGLQKKLKGSGDRLERRKTLVERLRAFRDEKDFEKKNELDSEISGLSMTLQAEDITSSLEEMGIFSLGLDSLKKSDIAKLEEASAWLFENIVLQTYAHQKPLEGEILLRIRDYESFLADDAHHHGAYRFAQQLSSRYGSPVKAFQEIAYLTDSKKTEDFVKTIDTYNSSENIQDGILKNLSEFDEILEQADLIKRVFEQSNQIFDEYSDYETLDDLFFEQRRAHIFKLQGEVAEAYLQYNQLFHEEE